MHLHHSSIDIFDMHSRDQQHAARELRKYILGKERRDWEWPPRASSPGLSGAKLDPASLPAAIRAHALVENGAVGWGERQYGSSDEEGGAPDGHVGEGTDGARDGSFTFESPESVGCTLEQRGARRKRRWKAKLEEELGWNEGLRCFVERRNAWTGARRRDDRSISSLVLGEQGMHLAAATEAPGMQGLGDGAVETDKYKPLATKGQSEAAAESLNNRVSILPGKEEGEEPDTEEPIRGNARDDTKLPPTPVPRPISRGRVGKRLATPTPLPGPIPDADPVIPVPPPFIEPSNVLRAAIQPKVYSNIYTQIVQSTRTPSVPIPLTDMTRALVEGWKDAGEWPPKATPVSPARALVSSRRHTTSGRQEVIGRLLDGGAEEGRGDARREGEYRGDDGIGGHGISVPPGLSIGEGLLSHHSHIRKGVEGVKRVLKLSGNLDRHSSHGSDHGDGEGGAAAVG